MSTVTQELVRTVEQLPEAKRIEVADFARFLLTGRGGNIRRTNGIVGGDARVRDTRIPVWTLVQLQKQGRSEQELVADFPGLTQDDLDAVWAYYREHTAEIEHAIGAEAREE